MKLRRTKIVPFLGHPVETSLYCVVQNVFRYLELFSRGSRVWQTDRQTDEGKDRQNRC